MVRLFNGNTMYYTDATNQIVMASIYDPLYAQLTEVMTQQNVAQRENLQAYGRYMELLADYQGALSSGRLASTVPPLTVPLKPQYKIVADAPDAEGNPVATFTPWPTPLPDPVIPKVYGTRSA